MISISGGLMNVRPAVIEAVIIPSRVTSSGRLVQLPSCARAFWLEFNKHVLLHLVSLSLQLGGQAVNKMHISYA